jgi:hypothetical protein
MEKLIIGAQERRSFPPKDQVHHCQHYNRADKCDQQAGQVKSGNSRTAKQAENPTSNCCAYNSGYDVGNAAHAVVALHNNAGQPSSDAAQNDPAENAHDFYLSFLILNKAMLKLTYLNN